MRRPAAGVASATAIAVALLMLAPTLGAASPPLPSSGAIARPSGVTPSWTRISVGAPHPAHTYGAGMAYDPKSGSVVLFGPGNQTWIYRSGTWRHLHPRSAPSPREFPAMTWDAKDGYVLLEGGQGCGGYCTDTWSFAGGAWTNLTAAGGPGVTGHWVSMAYDPVAKSVVLYAGRCCIAGASSTWVWSTGKWSSINTSTPDIGKFGNAEVVYDPPSRSILLVSAFNLTCPGVGDCLHSWELRNGNWTELANVTFYDPEYFGLAWDRAYHEVVLYGNSSAWNRPEQPALRFQGGSWSVLPGSKLPQARSGASISWDSAAGYLLLFGGSGKRGPLATSWEYS